MKKVFYKPYWNYEKEEKWLNRMAKNGWALTRYTWCRYEFSPCEPSEYVYRIEMLGNMPSSEEGESYIDFLKETEIECVSTYMYWAYFRKKASDCPNEIFELYSDYPSQIAHIRRILALYLPLGLLNFSIFLLNLSHYLFGRIDSAPFLFIICASGLCAFLCFSLGVPLLRKMRAIQKARKLRE